MALNFRKKEEQKPADSSSKLQDALNASKKSPLEQALNKPPKPHVEETKKEAAAAVNKTPTPTAASSLSISADEYNFDDQPEKYTRAQVQNLHNALQLIETHIGDKEIIGDAVKNVLQLLQETPELCEILRPENGGLMVRALRESYGVVIQKKSERKGKRAVKQAVTDDFLANLTEFDLSGARK